MSRSESWRVVVFVALPVVSIAAAALIARQVDDGRNRIAVYAAVVATVGTVLNAVEHARGLAKEHRERREEADAREVLRATAEFGVFLDSTPVIGVELYNAGKTTVPVRRVYLLYLRAEGERTRAVAMVCSDFRKVCRVGGRPQELPEVRHRVDIEPRKHARFHVDWPGGPGPDAVLEFPPDALSIVVESFTGEVVRVLGGEIQEAIRKFRDREG